MMAMMSNIYPTNKDRVRLWEKVGNGTQTLYLKKNKNYFIYVSIYLVRSIIHTNLIGFNIKGICSCFLKKKIPLACDVMVVFNIQDAGWLYAQNIKQTLSSRGFSHLHWTL